LLSFVVRCCRSSLLLLLLLLSFVLLSSSFVVVVRRSLLSFVVRCCCCCCYRWLLLSSSFVVVVRRSLLSFVVRCCRRRRRCVLECIPSLCCCFRDGQPPALFGLCVEARTPGTTVVGVVNALCGVAAARCVVAALSFSARGSWFPREVFGVTSSQ